MKITVLSPFDVSGNTPASEKDAHGCINAFRQDFFNMGTILGRNVTALYGNFDEEECKEIILVNTRTGQRIRVEFESKCHKCGKVGYWTFSCHEGMVCDYCLLPKKVSEIA